MCLVVDILWHFLCGGLSACWIRALAGFSGRSCCGLQLLPWVHVGGLCVLCGCLVDGICVGFVLCGGIH